MKKVIAALIAFAAIVLPQGAIAQVANRDEAGNIIVSGTGLAAGTLVKIYYPQVFDVRNIVTTGACNLLTINRTSTFQYTDWIKVNGTQLNLSRSRTPTLNAAACVNGIPNTVYSWITTGGYRYVQGGDEKKIYVLAPNAGQFSLQGDLPNFRLGKVDSCGRISIKNSAKWPMAALNFGGALSYIVNGLYGPDITIPTATTTAMPICRKGILYRKLEQ
jgi:hypothetical protein